MGLEVDASDRVVGEGQNPPRFEAVEGRNTWRVGRPGRDHGLGALLPSEKVTTERFNPDGGWGQLAKVWIGAH